MRVVIDRKIYDTATAEQVHWWDNGLLDDDMRIKDSALYRTSNGAYFVYGSGGPWTEFGVRDGQSSWTSGARIWPVSRDGAIRWLETHDGHEAIEKHFGEDLEEA